MDKILRLAPNVKELVLFLAIWSNDSVSGLTKSLHLIHPQQLTLVDGVVHVGSNGETEDGTAGVDEIHLVSTHFVSMITQTAQARRMAPLEVEYVDSSENSGQQTLLPAYEFEPSADRLLDEMLPKYIKTRIFAALLDSAASESAARRAACKAATDNANDIIRKLSREANQARQAQITQELSEIVGGADALAALGNEED